MEFTIRLRIDGHARIFTAHFENMTAAIGAIKPMLPVNVDDPLKTDISYRRGIPIQAIVRHHDHYHTDAATIVDTAAFVDRFGYTPYDFDD